MPLLACAAFCECERVCLLSVVHVCVMGCMSWAMVTPWPIEGGPGPIVWARAMPTLGWHKERANGQELGVALSPGLGFLLQYCSGEGGKLLAQLPVSDPQATPWSPTSQRVPETSRSWSGRNLQMSWVRKGAPICDPFPFLLGSLTCLLLGEGEPGHKPGAPT